MRVRFALDACARTRSLTASLMPQDQDAPDLFDVFLGGSHGQTPATEGMNCDSAVDTLTVSSVSRADRCRLNRKRKKHELEELRAAAAALELTLAQLTQPPSNNTNSLSPPWQQAARLARVECWKAVAENKRLRETLARQWTAAQRIHQAIRSTPVEQVRPRLPNRVGVGAECPFVDSLCVYAFCGVSAS
jgi:hypothetical protein